MAKYTLAGKEVTKEEFDREVYKGIDGTIVLNDSFFLDEILHSLFPTKDEEESKSVRGATIDMSELKGENAFKNLKFRNEKLSQEEKDKVNQLRTSITGVFCNEPYDFKLPVTGVINHTGGTVFEKVQDSTIPNKNIDPFYVVDIKNISKVDLKRNDLDEMLDYVFRGQYEDKQDPLEAYNAITGHSTRHKSQGVKQEYLCKGINNPPNPIKGWQPVPKIGKKESKTVEKAPIFTYCKQMKNAIEALSLRSLYGHRKYEKGDDWENFSRVENGDFEYSNAEFRHALCIGNDEDEEQHLVASAWNSVAKLELYLRNKK